MRALILDRLSVAWFFSDCLISNISRPWLSIPWQSLLLAVVLVHNYSHITLQNDFKESLKSSLHKPKSFQGGKRLKLFSWHFQCPHPSTSSAAQIKLIEGPKQIRWHGMWQWRRLTETFPSYLHINRSVTFSLSLLEDDPIPQTFFLFSSGHIHLSSVRGRSCSPGWGSCRGQTARGEEWIYEGWDCEWVCMSIHRHITGCMPVCSYT